MLNGRTATCQPPLRVGGLAFRHRQRGPQLRSGRAMDSGARQTHRENPRQRLQRHAARVVFQKNYCLAIHDSGARSNSAMTSISPTMFWLKTANSSAGIQSSFVHLGFDQAKIRMATTSVLFHFVANIGGV